MGIICLRIANFLLEYGVVLYLGLQLKGLK